MNILSIVLYILAGGVCVAAWLALTATSQSNRPAIEALLDKYTP